MTRLPVRLGASLALAGSLALAVGACSKTAENVAAQNTTVPVSAVSQSPTTTESVTPGGTRVDVDPGTTVKKGGTSTTVKKGPTTTVKQTGADFAAAALDAFHTKLGEWKALELVVHVDNGNAEIQVQDPAKPANVDDYTYNGGSVEGPAPVKLTGDGALEDNLFAISEVTWEAIPSMMDQATTALPAEGSKGVTHLIVKKNLPFDSDTVVDVYVDGGDRTQGGYVSFKADGTLKKVYGPS